MNHYFIRKTKKIIGIFLSKVSHIKYAKWVGVNMGENINIYGNPKNMFGTEPWCITLGNNVYITDGVKFITHDGGTLLFRKDTPDLEITKPIIVGNNVYIGVNTLIMPGVEIGDNVIIAAGSVITKNLDSNFVFGGVPASKIKSIEEYLEKIKKESLHLGHLSGYEKDMKLKEYFNYRK